MEDVEGDRAPGAWRGAARGVIVVGLLAALLLPEPGLSARFPEVPGPPPPPPGEDPRSPRPDIVVFMLDDVPPLDGRLWQRLPNIRRTFIERGVALTDTHGETPTCCPGRAGFLTGLHTHHHGAFRTDGRLFRPGMTIATALQRAGYHTIQVGKYFNLFDLIPDKTPPGWTDFHGFGGGYYDYAMWSNGRRRSFGSKPRAYSTDVIRRLSLRALRRAPRGRPLFAWITPYTFHKPWRAAPRHRRSPRCKGIGHWKPPGYMERNVRDKPAYVRKLRVRQRRGFDLRRVCRGLQSVDQLVGRVVKKLERDGRLENTLLILTSDNGMTYGAHRIVGDKKSPYATQIPFFVRWPRVLGDEPGTIGERVQNIDLAPTLCDIAGCRLGPYPTGQRAPDGVSFLGLLMGHAEQLPRDAVLSSYQDPTKWMPTWWSVTTTGRSPLAARGCRAREESGCRWLYVEYGTGARELYDVSNGPCWAWERSMRGDPCRLQNLAGRKRYRSIQADLARQLRRLRA